MSECEASIRSWHSAASLNKFTDLQYVHLDDQESVGSWLSRELGCSMTRSRKLCFEGAVTLNGNKAFANTPLCSNDEVKLSASALEVERSSAVSLETQLKSIGKLYRYGNHVLSGVKGPLVYYEDDFLAVCYKPSGIHTLPYERIRNQVTFKDLLPMLLSVPSPISMSARQGDSVLHCPVPCHRLDSRVDGLVVVAKTTMALAGTNGLFSSTSTSSTGRGTGTEAGRGKQVEKWYRAELDGCLELGSGGGGGSYGDVHTYEQPLSRDHTQDPHYTAPYGTNHGHNQEEVAGTQKEAEAEAEMLPCQTAIRVVSTDVAHGSSTVLLSPVTGRRHQLRRHMSALGCPIRGDGLYRGYQGEGEGGKGLGKLQLRAVSVRLPHPCVPGQEVSCSLIE